MSAPSTTSSRRSAPPQEEILPGSESVAWRHVIGFVLLAYGLAWAIWAALLGPTIKVALQDGRTPEHFTATAAVTLGMYAPALAAVLMRLFISKEGLRRALGPLPSLKIGLAAVLLPLALVLILIAIVTMINVGEPTPGKPMGSLLAILTFVGVPIGTLLAFGEESDLGTVASPRADCRPELSRTADRRRASCLLAVGDAAVISPHPFLCGIRIQPHRSRTAARIVEHLLGSPDRSRTPLRQPAHRQRGRRHRERPRRHRHLHHLPRPCPAHILVATNHFHKENNHEQQDPNRPPDHDGADHEPGRHPNDFGAAERRGGATAAQPTTSPSS